MEIIKNFIHNAAERFFAMGIRKRIIILSVIGCVVAGSCAALAVGLRSSSVNSINTGTSIAEEKQKALEEKRRERETDGLGETEDAEDENAGEDAAEAETGSSSDEADESSTQTKTTNAAQGVTGESSIAANAASSGGTDVVSYQQRNRQQMAAYENEVVPESEQRIVATSSAVCDIMDRLGINLVGVPETTVSSIASRYNGVTRVGSSMEPDMEIIKSLNPTDVIGPDTLQADLQMKYDNIGVQSTFINLRSVGGLYESVRVLGHKYGKQAEADAIIAEYNEFISSYSSGHKSEASPKVLVLMGLPGSYLVATQNSYAGSLVELAGGTNVFQDSSKDFLSVNTEEILARDPDVIIRTAHGLPKEAIEMFNREFSTNDIWKHFRAVKEGKVYDVDYMLFGMSATFDYPQALAELEPMLYGN
ncbi:MAG: heme ABC transporter substrate-binding protein IsdE [Candidatus Ornithomonoglobus sp.]